MRRHVERVEHVGSFAPSLPKSHCCRRNACLADARSAGHISRRFAIDHEESLCVPVSCCPPWRLLLCCPLSARRSLREDHASPVTSSPAPPTPLPPPRRALETWLPCPLRWSAAPTRS